MSLRTFSGRHDESIASRNRLLVNPEDPGGEGPCPSPLVKRGSGYEQAQGTEYSLEKKMANDDREVGSC